MEIVSDDFPIFHRCCFLLIVQNRLQRGLTHFQLCAHFLQARSKRFDLLLLMKSRSRSKTLGSFKEKLNTTPGKSKTRLEEGCPRASAVVVATTVVLEGLLATVVSIKIVLNRGTCRCLFVTSHKTAVIPEPS